LKAAIDSNVDSSDTTSRSRSVKKRDRKRIIKAKDKESDDDQPRPPSPILDSDEDGSSIKESKLINLLSNKINILFVFLQIVIFLNIELKNIGTTNKTNNDLTAEVDQGQSSSFSLVNVQITQDEESISTSSIDNRIVQREDEDLVVENTVNNSILQDITLESIYLRQLGEFKIIRLLPTNKDKK
jgi:hypothetical protein